MMNGKTAMLERSLRLSASMLAMLAGLACPPAASASAQTPAAGSQAETQPAEEQPAATADLSRPAEKRRSAEAQEIVVTGTNISGVKATGSEAVVVNRDDILAAGKTNIADVVKTIPQLQPLGLSEAASGPNANTGNVNRGTALNLRGIGSNATLLLVDGHRLAPSGTATSFSEAIQVPITAVQRVEVVADSASAVYGSDAIAGVINYVLRKDYRGIELDARYTHHRYAGEYALGGVAGTHWSLGGLGEGNVLVAYEHSRRDNVRRGDIPYFRQDLSRFGGGDFRISGNTATPGNPGNIVVSGPFGSPAGPVNPAFPQAQGYLYYALPTSSDPNFVPTAAQISAGANRANLVDRSDYEDLLPLTRRDQASLFINENLGERVSVYNETFYTKRESETRTFLANSVSSSSFGLTIQPGTPYYISGIPGVAAGQPYTVQYNLAAHVFPNGPRFLNENPERTLSTTTGVRARLFGDWRGDIYYTYGQTKTCGVCYLGNFINGDPDSAFTAAVNAGLINPYTTAPLTGQQLSLVLGTNSQRAQNYFHDAVAKVDGGLFDLPAGRVKAAVGGEFSFLINKLQNLANRGPNNLVDFNDADSRRTRKQYAAFAELFVPIVGEDMNVPLMQELRMTAAVRRDHYSDFGATTNPKLGATWKVSPDLSLRGSWGKAFRAPGLPELEPGLLSIAVQIPFFPNNSGRPDIPTVFPGVPFSNILFRFGANPALDAEKGKNWSLGFDASPRWLPGLRFSGTYYNIAYKDRLFTPNIGVLLSSPEAAAAFSPYIIPIAPQPGCVAGNVSTYNPALVPFITNFLYGAASITDPCGIRVVLDARYQNASATTQDGIDAQANYRFHLFGGSMEIAGLATKILHNRQRIVPALPAFEAIDRIAQPVSFRARGSIGYSRGPLSATLFVNRVGKYRNDQPDTVLGVLQPETDVPGWTTFDLSLGVAFDEDQRWGWLRNWRAGLSIQNLFDKRPPIVLSSQTAVDLNNHNPYGPIVQLQIAKGF
jgi:iron complex outermembrane receptor protein